jgi:hypothetical protein
MGCKCLEQSSNTSNQNLESNTIVVKGQSNNFRDYSNFSLKVVKLRHLTSEELEIEGFMTDKKGKSSFIGRITKQKISIECRTLSDQVAELVNFEGMHDATRSKYIGEFKMKRSQKGFGSFWMEQFNEDFWNNSYKFEGSSCSNSTRFDVIRKTESHGQNSNLNII